MFFYHLTNFPTGWFGYDQMALNADAMFDLGRHMWDKGLLPTTCTLLWSWLRTTLFMYTRWRYLVKSEKHFCAIVLNLAKIGLFCLPLTHYGKRFAKKFLQSFSHYFLWYDNLQASIWEPLNDAYLSTLLWVWLQTVQVSSQESPERVKALKEVRSEQLFKNDNIPHKKVIYKYKQDQIDHCPQNKLTLK